MSVPAAKLYEWWNLCSELDGHLPFIRDAEEKKMARKLLDRLEREIYEAYRDEQRDEIAAMCAPTRVHVDRRLERELVGGGDPNEIAKVLAS